MNKILLVFQLVQIIESTDPANQPSGEIYFYSPQRCVAVAELLRSQQNSGNYRYRYSYKGKVEAYCKAVYVRQEKEEAGLIWH
jgi:hypothetical protein|tara:strand:- start:1348 stop:1596 length:249 start_codon:yes stop_codon:yes gene_type:complete